MRPYFSLPGVFELLLEHGAQLRRQWEHASLAVLGFGEDETAFERGK